MASVWGRQETLKLIEIWGDDNIQRQLEGCHRNREVYVRVSRLMSKSQFERTFEQCREKVKKLKKEYRRIKDILQETGQGRGEEMEWQYFEPMDKILGHKPTTVPEAVVDSLATQNQSVENDEEREEVTKVDETILFGDTSDSGTVESSSTTDSSATTRIRENSKKKKRSRGTNLKW